MTRHRPTSSGKPPGHWRIFHRCDPYRDKEERRDAERARARAESNAFRKALAFAHHKDPGAKASQIMRQSQTRRAGSEKYAVALPPPFPKRP